MHRIGKYHQSHTIARSIPFIIRIESTLYILYNSLHTLSLLLPPKSFPVLCAPGYSTIMVSVLPFGYFVLSIRAISHELYNLRVFFLSSYSSLVAFIMIQALYSAHSLLQHTHSNSSFFPASILTKLVLLNLFFLFDCLSVYY